MISIISINYNNKLGMLNTLTSVFNQTFTDFELIVIDGCSVDGSIDVLKSYSDKITYWVSEKDRGVYHAMNKGLAKAKGDYCLFLNSGDCLITKDVLKNVSEVITNTNSNYDLYYGCHIWRETGERWNPKRDFRMREVLDHTPIPHQASFFSTSKLKLIGGYKEQFSIISDWGMLLDFMRNKFRFYKLELDICICEPPGVSQKSPQIILDERKKYLFKYAFKYYLIYFFVKLFKSIFI